MTQQKQASPFSEIHLQLAIEATNIGVWDWDVTHDQMIWNEHHRRIFGLSMDAFTNYEHFLNCIHPDDRARVDGLVWESLATRTEYNTEYRILWPDGSVRWVAARGRGIYDAQGKATRMIGVVLDITARKEAEESQRAADKRAQEILEAAHQRSEELVRELATKQAFLQALMEQVPAGLVIVEAPSGRLIFHNEEAARLLGSTPTGVHRESEDYRKYVQPGMAHVDGSPYRENEYPVLRVLRTGEVIKQETMLYRRCDGTASYLAMNVAPIRDEQQKTIAVVCTLHDISEHYELEKKKDEFISIASHELRTPLTAMSGNLQMAERRLNCLLSDAQHLVSAERRKLAEDTAMRVERALNQVKIQSRMIDDLLDVTRIQTRKLRLVREPCDLIQIVQDVLSDVRTVSPGRLILLETPEVPEITINADCIRIGQVIHNFLTNALKYSPDSEPVTVGISLEENGREARVWVRDAGPGLSQEAQQQIWSRFYQTSGSRGKRGVDGGGLGLGLYISHALIQEHDGDIGVQSAPGEGSRFWFALPLFSR
jgi:PAS domain S-box-containing protein